MTSLHVEFDLPTVLISQVGLDTNNVSRDVRRMFALFLYEHKRISLSKACELGGVSLWEFTELNRQLGISLPYSVEDLNEDMQRLADV